MAGNRDRLRSMSKKNVQEVEKVKDVPTLISDVADRIEEEPEDKAVDVKDEFTKEENVIQKSDGIDVHKNQVEEEVPKEPQLRKDENQEEISGLINAPSEITSLPADEKKEDAKENVRVEPEKLNTGENSNVSQAVSENVQEEKTTDLQKGWDDKVKELNEKYQGQEVIVSLLLRPEASNYLTYKAMDLRISGKQLLKNLLMKELVKGYSEDDMIYRLLILEDYFPEMKLERNGRTGEVVINLQNKKINEFLYQWGTIRGKKKQGMISEDEYMQWRYCREHA